MRVFVTGSTGFVGTAVVKELVSHGHTVLGLTRTPKGAEQLKSQGAEPLQGTIQDLEILSKAASESDAVVHLAFVHDFSDFAGSCATDRAAITAMGDALVAAGGDRALVITSGTMLLGSGGVKAEDAEFDMSNPMLSQRGMSETLTLAYADKGIRASAVRLAPTTHGPGGSGFMSPFIMTAMQKGASAYVGDGQNRWPACHRDDAAKIYRLAAEKAQGANIFHGVAEEGVYLKDIATEVGKQLDIPVISIPPENVEEHFGWFKFGIAADNAASNAKTKEILGWTPTSPTVLEDVPRIIEFLKAQTA